MNFKKPAYFSSASVLLFLSKVSTAFANGNDEHVEEVEKVSGFTTDEIIRTNSIRIAIAAGVILIILVIISSVIKEKSESVKKILFGLMTAAIVLPTLYFTLSTLYLNFTSYTGGPVHWHADYRIFVCGEEIFLKSPEGVFSNKVGTAVFHHHDDARIHVEGTVINPSDVSLSSFFMAIGGELTQTSFSIPAAEGLLQVNNNDLCPNGSEGEWQTFLYKTEGVVATQTKLEHYAGYVPSPEVNIPPGDCLIFEFAESKEKTENICSFYEIEQDKGELEIVYP